MIFRLALVGIGALGLVGCGEVKEADSVEAVAMPDLVKLQQLADKACLCEMRAGVEGQCWDAFEQAHEGIPATGFGSASAPLSFETICFSEAGSQCVSAGARLVDQSLSLVCTDEQVNEIEALYDRVMGENGPQTQVADTAARERIAEMSAALRSGKD